MKLTQLSRRSVWALFGAATLAACLTVPATAVESRCDRAFVSQGVQKAMLAFKATQYCTKTPLPYTDLQAISRLDELRCNSDVSNMIDELDRDFDKQYRMIMTRDEGQTVCKHAATLDLK